MMLAALGPPYAIVAPTAPLPGALRLIGNDALATELGLGASVWNGPEATDVFAGNRPWPGYAPRATAYAGHQFGRYTRRLGDGRAMLIAEIDERSTARPSEPRAYGVGPAPLSCNCIAPRGVST